MMTEQQNANVTELPKRQLPPGWKFAASSIDEASMTHRDILYCNLAGMTTAEISKRLGVNSQTVSKCLHHPPYMKFLHESRDKAFQSVCKANKKLTEAQEEVAEALLDEIRNGKAQARLSAIKLYASMFNLGRVGMVIPEDEESDERLPSGFDNSAITDIRKTVGE